MIYWVIYLLLFVIVGFWVWSIPRQIEERTDRLLLGAPRPHEEKRVGYEQITSPTKPPPVPEKD